MLSSIEKQLIIDKAYKEAYTSTINTLRGNPSQVAAEKIVELASAGYNKVKSMVSGQPQVPTGGGTGITINQYHGNPNATQQPNMQQHVNPGLAPFQQNVSHIPRPGISGMLGTAAKTLAVAGTAVAIPYMIHKAVGGSEAKGVKGLIAGVTQAHHDKVQAGINVLKAFKKDVPQGEKPPANTQSGGEGSSTPAAAPSNPTPVQNNVKPSPVSFNMGGVNVTSPQSTASKISFSSSDKKPLTTMINMASDKVRKTRKEHPINRRSDAQADAARKRHEAEMTDRYKKKQQQEAALRHAFKMLAEHGAQSINDMATQNKK